MTSNTERVWWATAGYNDKNGGDSLSIAICGKTKKQMNKMVKLRK